MAEAESFRHETVLLSEAVDSLNPRDGGHYVDCTLGGAGHTALLLDKSKPSGRLLAIDQDETAILHARARLQLEMDRVTLVRSNFRDIRRIVEDHAFGPIDGILFDLGVSSPQFDEGDRGFSYRLDAPLDMRMDNRIAVTAKDLVNESSEASLAQMFFDYGEERFSRRIARAIVERRTQAPIAHTVELAEIVKAAIPAAVRRSGPHPARRVFQALRIAVNDELGALKTALDGAFEVLAGHGRMAVITFHSLEDRIVKQAFQAWCQGCICPPDFPICQCGRHPRAKLVFRKPLVPSEAETANNPRARSAKLRVLERLEPMNTVD